MKIRNLSALTPFLAILGSVTALGLGTSLAKHTLFPVIGAEGTTALRVGFSALLMLALCRPWRWRLSAADSRAIACYGAALGAMNLCFYMSLRTIPFGVAVAIEFAGPLAVALVSSRRPLDFTWVMLALAGLGLLLPLGHEPATLDPVGMAYAGAAAVCWACYILFGKRVQHLPAAHSVSLGLAVAALVVVPIGLPGAGRALADPWILGVGLCVAAISSALPIFLEMAALKRLSPQAFGVMISMEPAVAALLALGLLDEYLTPAQWLAVGLIVSASIGITVTLRRASSSLCANVGELGSNR